MISHRRKPLVHAAIALAAVWVVAMAGYYYAQNQKVTPEKVRAYLHDVNLGKLSPEERAKALQRLAHQLNSLGYNDRREARMDAEWQRWFKEMTDQEKVTFLESTLPTGFQQMFKAFENLPEDKRQRAVADALRRLREAREDESKRDRFLRPEGERTGPPPPPLTPEMQKKVVSIGLGAYFSQSSAQTKAELAPLLEEMQRAMESGMLFRNR